MRSCPLTLLLASIAALVVSCGGKSFGTNNMAPDDGVAGTSGVGGSQAGDGDSDGADAGKVSDVPSTSLGTTTLSFSLLGNTSYCEERQCNSSDVFTLLDSHGTVLDLGSANSCDTDCTSCVITPCPAVDCATTGERVTGGTLEWDGHFFEAKECGIDPIPCQLAQFAKPGTYVARMCATPGRLEGSPISSCVATASERCVDIQFEYPGETEVQGSLNDPKANGVLCAANVECVSRFCYGDVNTAGEFGEAACQAKCLNPTLSTQYCDDDADCCEGSCCVDCGELSGRCVNK